MSASASSPQDVSLEQPWEKVDHVSNFYDFPLEGLADYNSAPHVFFFFDENYQPDPEDPQETLREVTYSLHPASEALAADIRERHDIFERWHQAWSGSKDLMKDHPALPEDRARHEALKAIIDPQLKALRDSKKDLVRVGNFAGNRRTVAPGGSRWTSFEVQWLQPKSA